MCNMKRMIAFLVTTITVLTLLGGAALAETTHAVFADAGWDSIRLHDAIAQFVGEICLQY